MSNHTVENAADKIAAQRARVRRTNYVIACVNLRDIEVEVDLTTVDTEDLREELIARGDADDPELGDVLSYERLQEVERIYHLFHIGRREEAANASERLLCDILGRVA